MSISEISEIKMATNYTLESKNNSSAKNEIIGLFSGSQFNNGGLSSANVIANEVQTLQTFISEKNNKYEQKTAELKVTQNELKLLNKKLEDEILEVTNQAKKEENEQRSKIQNAINEVNQMYMNGDIEKSSMSSELSIRISKYSKLSSGVTSKTLALNGTKARISALTDKIATLIDSANSIEKEINTAAGTMSLMQNLMDKMTVNGSVNSNDAIDSGAMGFISNGKNYNFIIDKNSDRRVNGSSEFLGTEKGFDELKNMDKNGDNIINYDELNSNNMYVLMTDNQTGSSKFMSILESGVTSINLSTITSEDFNELEEPEVQNIFTVNTVSGASVQGYDKASVTGFNDTEMIVGIDESVLRRAYNIFSKEASLSDEGLEENVLKADSLIKSAQSDIKKTSNEMSANNSNASSRLTTQERPETQEEREEREAEEAKKAEEEKKAKEEKIAEEAKKAKEEAKAKEEKKIKEAEEAKKAEEKKKAKEIEEKQKAAAKKSA